MPSDLSHLISSTFLGIDADGLAGLRREFRSQASRIALRATIGVVAVAGINMIAPGEAWAGCVLATDVVCSGPTPDTITSITGAQSVTYQNGETNSSGKGLAVIGSAATPTVSVAIDPTSSITATDGSGASGGAALLISNNNGAITTTTPTKSGINGNLTSTVGAGLSAQTNNIAGDITIVQGATSTITGTTTGILARVNDAGSINVNVAGNVTATAGNAIDVGATNGAVVSDGAVTVTTLAGGVISANGGNGILANNSLKGTGGITITSNA
ncbi:MAG: hypothetical protein WBL74_10265, partial [Novosphingobium sp.]|uniref:hypothetical protein n=1 Tax=Novosphingobium sp. TaxID=1874826 RepID=UPI003C7CF12B